jgi:hypothetical protein
MWKRSEERNKRAYIKFVEEKNANVRFIELSFNVLVKSESDIRRYIEKYIEKKLNGKYDETRAKKLFIDYDLTSSLDKHLPRKIYNAFNKNTAPRNDTLHSIHILFSNDVDYSRFCSELDKNNPDFLKYLNGFAESAPIIEAEEGYEKNNLEREKEIKHTPIKIARLNNWYSSTNFSTPQWADFSKIPIESGLIKRVRCKITIASMYYRFGFKLFRRNGKLFGDGSIQSMDNNFVIHIGKNFLSDELFITTYINGIRQRPDKYTGIKPLNSNFTVELSIDDENFLKLIIDEKEVHKKIINKEIREQIYMLVWGDGNEYKLSSENIEIEYEIE